MPVGKDLSLREGEGGRWTTEEEGEGEDLPLMSNHPLNLEIRAKVNLVFTGARCCASLKLVLQ